MFDFRLAKFDFPHIRFHEKQSYLSAVTVGVFCANETVFSTTGTALVLMCNISIRDSITYPIWWGPPDNTRYNTNSTFNPNLGEKLNRLNWTNNSIDLQLNSVMIKDKGLYRCEVIFQERTYLYKIEVNVRGKFKYLLKFNSPSDLF